MMSVQYKSKQNTFKSTVFNAYIIIYAGSVFWRTPCILHYINYILHFVYVYIYLLYILYICILSSLPRSKLRNIIYRGYLHDPALPGCNKAWDRFDVLKKVAEHAEAKLFHCEYFKAI